MWHPILGSQPSAVMSDLLEQAGLTPGQIQAVRGMMVEAQRRPRFVYPWDRLETTLTNGVQSLSVVGYGSLLNRSSSANTLSETALAARRPVLAFGVLRLFNYDLGTVSGRYGPPVAAESRAALNARVTGQIGDVINGVLVPVGLSDVDPFRGREVGYDLESVPCLDWEQQGSPFVAYVLCSPDEPRGGKTRTSPELEPHRAYYDVCHRGAGEFGEKFQDFWLASTFLGDEVTRVAEWAAAR